MPVVLTAENTPYKRSWVCQRILNNLPSSENARRLPFSIAQQLLNPIAFSVQNTYQQLAQSILNAKTSSFNMNLPSDIWSLDISDSFEFQESSLATEDTTYSAPDVTGYIDSTAISLTAATDNDIESFTGNTIPTRIEDSGVSKSYSPVLDFTTADSLSSASLSDIVVYGHLYITVKDNTTWRHEFQEYVYYPKVRITGETRKRTEVTEEVPIQQNGTFKTVNQWRSVSKIEHYYLDDSASICVESFPFNAEYLVDENNLYVLSQDTELFQYFDISENEEAFYFDLDCYVDTIDDLNMAQALGNHKDNIFSLSLDNISPWSSLPYLVMSSFPNLAYIINNSGMSVYDIRLPLPDNSLVSEDDPESNIDIYSDKWVVKYGENAKFTTRLLDHTNPPFRYRMKLTVPDGFGGFVYYWIGLDGSKHSLGSTNGWIQNERWDISEWEDKHFSFLVEDHGENVLTFECLFSDESTGQTYTRKSQFMFYCPKIAAETSLNFPDTFSWGYEPEGAAKDSDGNIWLLSDSGTVIRKIILRYDYFVIDYERKRVWVREEYDKMKVSYNTIMI